MITQESNDDANCITLPFKEWITTKILSERYWFKVLLVYCFKAIGLVILRWMLSYDFGQLAKLSSYTDHSSAPIN